MRDMYGIKRGAKDRQDHPHPYEIESSTAAEGGATTRYTRYFETGDDPCGILKEIIVGDVANPTSYKCYWAFDKWANRATATYVPVNESWDYQG